MKVKENKKGVKIFIAIMVIFSIVIIGYYASMPGETKEVSKVGSIGGPYVAQINVVGEISAQGSSALGGSNSFDYQWTLDTIEGLIDDNDNQGILLYVDSPGGGVYESDELYLKLEKYKKLTGRPVFAYFGQTAASGGYYISAASDKIMANRNTTTGSIGVRMGPIFDVSQLLEKYGIKSQSITSGANKDMGSSFAPMSNEQKAIFQSIVDEAYDQFVGVVAKGRKMDEAKVREIADGRIYTGKQAQSLGLVDEVCTFEEASKKVLKEKKIDSNAEIVELAPENVESFLDTLLSDVKSAINLLDAKNSGDLGAIERLMKEGQNMEPKYMS